MFNVCFFEKDDEKEWDILCENSHKGTFLHTRHFLNYHKERFIDRSVVVRKKGEVVAILPAAIYKKEDTKVVSHPGATYGGVITDARIYGEELISIFSLIFQFYKNNGYTNLLYKVTPSVFHVSSDEDELYALHRLDARVYRMDVSAVLNLNHRMKISSQRKRSYKKAIKSKAILSTSINDLDEFYKVLVQNLNEKHSATPVHSLDELKQILDLFPNKIELVTSKVNNKIISGVLFFCINNVKHAQYISSSSEGYEKGGLDFLFEEVISMGLKDGFDYISFGISNENEGKVLNESLYRFKRQFGSGSVIHSFYSVELLGF